MNPLTRSERLQVESIKELEQSGFFDVSHVQEGISFPLADFDPLSETRKEWEGVVLGAELKECALRFISLSCSWSSVDFEKEVFGEFYLPHLYIALTGVSPRHNDLATERERSLLSELRMIDSAPIRATGEAAFIRIERHKDPLEIWYQDRYLFDARRNTQGFLKMELGYCEYLKMLRMVKGAFGWQMLFVDAFMRGDAFRPHVENIENMLQVFPSIFSWFDYSALRARLEERL